MFGYLPAVSYAEEITATLGLAVAGSVRGILQLTQCDHGSHR